MLKVFTTLASLMFTLTSARSYLPNADAWLMPPPQDNSTYGNIDQIRTKHVHFNLTADFDQSVFFGWAYHTMEIVDDAVTLA